MKRFLFFTLFMFLTTTLSQSQLNVKTEASGGKYKNYSSAQVGDTILRASSTVVLGSSTPAVNFGISGYVVGVLIGSPVASDTIIIKNGVGIVTQIILPASGLSPYYIPIGARLDTSMIYIQKKASNVSLIYRTSY
jgi:hypothetical protein